MPARFVFISGTPANVEQGSGTWVGIAALRRALQSLGHDVELLAPSSASPSAWRRLAFNWRLRRRRFPADAQVVGFDLDGLFVPAARTACIKGVLAEEMQFERGIPRARLWFQSRLERWRVRRAARVLVTSDYAAEAVVRRYGIPPARLRVVPELLDVAAWQADLASVPLDASHGATLLAVAHLYPRKDIPTLLRALPLLPASVTLHLVGDGPERCRLQKLAAHLGLGARVRFLGHVPRAALLHEYRNATLFCHPSRQEGFGIVLLEAMASGLPIVAARAAAIPEVVPAPSAAACRSPERPQGATGATRSQTGEPPSGLLFPPGDPVALAAAVSRLLADEPLRRSLADAARARVLRFTPVVVAGEFLAALAEPL